MHDQIRSIVGEPLEYYGGGIYQIQLLGTDRCYVGRSIGVGGRLFDHVKALLLNKHGNPKLQRAWNKYGHDRFAFKILQKVDPAELATAEQSWINHFQAASIGFNIVPLVTPYAPIDGSDPNVIKYRHALDAVSFAMALIGGDQLPKKKRIQLEDCLHWNAYALSMLKTFPQEMIKARTTARIDEALNYANGRIKKTGNQTLMPYMAAPESYPHDASMPLDLFQKLTNDLAMRMSFHKEWEAAALKMYKQRASAIVGENEVKRQWRAVNFGGGLIGDGNFIEWCQSIGVKQPTGDELRAAGLVTWEWKKREAA